MDENKVKQTFQSLNVAVGDLLTKEEKSNLRTFAQKVHTMDINDVGKLHNGFADALTSEQKDIVAYEIKLREYDLFKKHGIDPKVAFSPENVGKNVIDLNGNLRNTKNVDYTNDRSMQGFIAKERTFNNEMSDELLERSKQILENTYIPIDATKLHEKNGGGINAMYNKIVAIDDNGNQIKINNRGIQEKFRKNYLKQLSDVTGIDYTRVDDDFYNDFTPMEMNQPDPTGFQNGDSVVFDKPGTVDQIDLSDYEDDDDDY